MKDGHALAATLTEYLDYVSLGGGYYSNTAICNPSIQTSFHKLGN